MKLKLKRSEIQRGLEFHLVKILDVEPGIQYEIVTKDGIQLTLATGKLVVPLYEMIPKPDGEWDEIVCKDKDIDAIGYFRQIPETRST